jgi:VWFA-related protein
MLFRLLAGLLAFSLVFAQAPPSASGSAVIKTTSRIVDVNVIAVDKHGNPVTDLGKEDFVIKESGKERPITLFSLETLDSKPTSEAMASGGFAGDAKTPRQMTFTNHVEQTTTGVTIFLFDGLNTKFEDQARAKAQLVKYLREVDAKDRVALFALGRSLVLLHDFTTDTQAMINAINRHGSRINTEVADAEPIQSNTGDEKMDEFLDNANQQIADYTNMLRATQTAAALEAIAGHVARIPEERIWCGYRADFRLRSDSIRRSRG